jgi:hypothetical protein
MPGAHQGLPAHLLAVGDDLRRRVHRVTVTCDPSTAPLLRSKALNSVELRQQVGLGHCVLGR